MVEHYTTDDVRTWIQSGDRRLFLGDVVDATNSDTMGVGFARYAPGESNPWMVTYDEALIITKGTFTVTPKDGPAATAGSGEVIYLRKGTELVYSAGDAGAELVYATYPIWAGVPNQAQAPLMDQFHPIDQKPNWTNNVALVQQIWGPLERGESEDLQPFWDSLADDVVMATPVGELHGKKAIQNYFAIAGDTVGFNPFTKPLRYYGDGNRVVITGGETFTIKATGATHEAEWVWLLDFEDGLTTRITAVQDLSAIADVIAAAVAKAAA